MRGFVVFLAALGVILLAWWAYYQNHVTQQAIAEKRALEREISGLHETIDVQRAEWAYLNRPARLRALAEVNFDQLELLPMQARHYTEAARIPYRLPELQLMGEPQQVIGTLQVDE